jgi:LysM repeat protein
MSAPKSIIAQPGDTLWAIARRIVPEGNIVELVDELVRINGQTIQAGQVVRLPG